MILDTYVNRFYASASSNFYIAKGKFFKNCPNRKHVIYVIRDNLKCVIYDNKLNIVILN